MTENIHKHRILILDFGSQYTQLVARRVRELGVYCELWAWDVTEAQIRDFNPSGIILSGGPESTTEENSPRAPQYVFEAGVPVFGVCYGMQTMAMQLGGHVEASNEREFGYAQVEVVNDSALVRGIEDALTADGKPLLDVWMSHGDKVTAIPSDFITVASTESCPFAIMANEEKRFYGVQFHPEVTHTRQGMRMLERFVRDICQCEALWTPAKIIDDAVARIREQVGDDKVILGLSGGVDSSVTAMLLHRAIGKNLTCVFVDNGLLRLNEAEQVLDMFGDHFGLNIVHVPAEDRFLSALAGENDPEAKRKIIGEEFIRVFEEEAKKIGAVDFLVQGTIYPDIVESGLGGESAVIKSHHNVGGLPDYVDFKEIIEPLRDLFKDEVRKAGLELGIPEYLVFRQPFPGPGLGVRIIGEVNAEKVKIVQDADAIYREELEKAGVAKDIGQYFAALTNMRSVGCMGDERTYDYAVALRAVTTVDFMTAESAEIPWEVLGKVMNRIVNEVDHVNRVLYDITSKPPGTIEFE